MADPFVGEIALVGFHFAPADWAFCDGSLLSIADYELLFSLIGTMYGGDGVNNFALPDLRGRVPIHVGQGPGLSSYAQGQTGGAQQVTLTVAQVPAHTHAPMSKGATGDTTSPAGAVPAGSSTGNPLYQTAAPNRAMLAGALGNTGGGQSHENRQPYLGLNYIIALFGIYPSRT